jgi:hypothetical protein
MQCVFSTSAASRPRSTSRYRVYNLIGKNDNSTGFTAIGDQTGTIATPLNPLLDPLANNGGPTQTRALRPTSPAIDKGNSLGLTISTTALAC